MRNKDAERTIKEAITRSIMQDSIVTLDWSLDLENELLGRVDLDDVAAGEYWGGEKPNQWRIHLI